MKKRLNRNSLFVVGVLAISAIAGGRALGAQVKTLVKTERLQIKSNIGKDGRPQYFLQRGKSRWFLYPVVTDGKDRILKDALVQDSAGNYYKISIGNHEDRIEELLPIKKTHLKTQSDREKGTSSVFAFIEDAETGKQLLRVADEKTSQVHYFSRK